MDWPTAILALTAALLAPVGCWVGKRIRLWLPRYVNIASESGQILKVEFASDASDDQIASAIRAALAGERRALLFSAEALRKILGQMVRESVTNDYGQHYAYALREIFAEDVELSTYHINRRSHKAPTLVRSIEDKRRSSLKDRVLNNDLVLFVTDMKGRKGHQWQKTMQGA